MIHTLIHQFGVENAERGNSKRQMKRGEEIEKQKRRGGKEIRGRDCEPRRENYGLFLVSSCVSHSVLRIPTGRRYWRETATRRC